MDTLSEEAFLKYMRGFTEGFVEGIHGEEAYTYGGWFDETSTMFEEGALKGQRIALALRSNLLTMMEGKA